MAEHPIMTKLVETHGDVTKLHPLLTLLDPAPTADGEDPTQVIIDLLISIRERLERIESAVRAPAQL